MEMPASSLTGLTLKDLLDAGLHFGHQTKRWNPKMKRYIFDKRNGIHIIDLTQTVTLLDEAAAFLRDVAASGGKILFVATKKQAQDAIRAAAVACATISFCTVSRAPRCGYAARKTAAAASRPDPVRPTATTGLGSISPTSATSACAASTGLPSVRR